MEIPLQLYRPNLKRARELLESDKIERVQTYFPAISKLFKTENLKNLREYAIRQHDSISKVVSPTEIVTSRGKNVKIFKKISMINSYYKTIQGKVYDINLPDSNTKSQALLDKVLDPNNAAYIGSIVSIVLSQLKCRHFPSVYGCYSGIAREYVKDISDYYPTIHDSSWFLNNIGKTFVVEVDDDGDDSDFRHTKSCNRAIEFGESVELEVDDEIQVENVETSPVDCKLEYTMNSDTTSLSGSSESSDIFDIESDCEEEDDDFMDTSEPFINARFFNIPVQVTVMERCEDSIFELMMNNNDTKKHLAWVAQVMFALAYAQTTIGFIHNDLHANNVMYIPTDIKYLFYKCDDKTYKVPTYGYLIKLIDFERCIAYIKLKGMRNAKLFISDNFALDEEAAGQYNYPPFYDDEYPVIEPNYSFDLSYFATSIFLDLFPDGETPNNLLYNLFKRWTTNDDGDSVLFSKSDPEKMRYHGFNIVKAISKYCIQNAIPRNEIKLLEVFETRQASRDILVV